MVFRNFNTEAIATMPKPKNRSSFDSIRVKFDNVQEWPSPLANSRTVPFVKSYLEVIKNCID